MLPGMIGIWNVGSWMVNMHEHGTLGDHDMLRKDRCRLLSCYLATAICMRMQQPVAEAGVLTVAGLSLLLNAFSSVDPCPLNSRMIR